MRISTLFFNQQGITKIVKQQSQINELQEKISSGKRVLTPADDPAATAQIIRLEQMIRQLDQFDRSATIANSRLGLEESTLGKIGNVLLQIRERIMQANNAALSDSDRRNIAQEIKERLKELFSLANTSDANNQYLFSGFMTDVQPFSQLADGTFRYNGDQGQRFLKISSGRTIADSESGMAVFMDIKNGNGVFRAQSGTNNQGNGIISSGQAFDFSSYVDDTYTIRFVTNAAGRLAYNITGENNGQVIPPPPADPIADAPDFSDGAEIRFNGMAATITGSPQSDDVFTISPSERQAVFTTIANLIAALESPGRNTTEKAKVHNSINLALAEIDQAYDNILRVRVDVGVRLNSIENRQNSNETFKLDLQASLAELRDLDAVEAVSALKQRMLALEAAQAVFVKVQNLSLFKFL